MLERQNLKRPEHRARMRAHPPPKIYRLTPVATG